MVRKQTRSPPSRGDGQGNSKMAQKGFRASSLAAGKGVSNNWDLKPREYRLPQRGYLSRKREPAGFDLKPGQQARLVPACPARTPTPRPSQGSLRGGLAPGGLCARARRAPERALECFLRPLRPCLRDRWGLSFPPGRGWSTAMVRGPPRL